MKSLQRLAVMISSLDRFRLRATFFRSIDLQWLLKGTPLSAIGSKIRGGRYNEKGAFEAIYVSDTQKTALFETQAIFDLVGVIVGVRQPPRVMLSLDCDLQRVVDLRSPPALRALGVTLEELVQPWKVLQSDGRPVLTQRIGAPAHAGGIEALLVPSARFRPGSNLVIFPDCLRKRSSVELFAGDDRLIPRYKLEGQL